MKHLTLCAMLFVVAMCATSCNHPPVKGMPDGCTAFSLKSSRESMDVGQDITYTYDTYTYECEDGREFTSHVSPNRIADGVRP